MNRITAAPTKTARNQLATDYGISRPTILDRIPSLQRPDSYPHEFMHLFLLNHGPNLVSLWTDWYDGISGPGLEDYLISADDWADIGRETFVASVTLPDTFTRPLPNIATDRRLFNAESWSFWFQYIGPVVLRGRLADKYYEHDLEFVYILKTLLALSSTTQIVEDLKRCVAGYVERFEEYYYQYSPERLAVCRLTLHALLHVPDDVLRCGPVWSSWSFLIERYCGVAVGAVKSKVNPYTTISNRVLEMAQLSALSSEYPSVKRALQIGLTNSSEHVTAMEETYPEYPCTILRAPCLHEYSPDDEQRRRLAGYFTSQFGTQGTFHEWFTLLPRYCTRYGKVRISGGGDHIRSTVSGNSLSLAPKRDATFVRFVFWRDKYENQRNRPPKMVKATEYGRLECILVLHLEPNPTLGIAQRTTRILADLTPCACTEGDATVNLVSYQRFQPRRILDIQAVENVVGRVSSRGRWYIIDRSVDGARTEFIEELGGFADV
ncbi:hypothetical protein BDV93DRAFT_567159 [Ceratobasidium sp. AG-I]|nr:hypothetical protein BDV93DRAFT_567159 [Ceratobasidium sp. AG-I]